MMNAFFHYTPYLLLALFIASSIATGIIYKGNRTKDNALIFIAFIIYTSTSAINTFLGYSATFDGEGNVISETEGLLSITQTQFLMLLAHLLLSIAFGIKAYMVIKKPMSLRDG